MRQAICVYLTCMMKRKYQRSLIFPIQSPLLMSQHYRCRSTDSVLIQNYGGQRPRSGKALPVFISSPYCLVIMSMMLPCATSKHCGWQPEQGLQKIFPASYFKRILFLKNRGTIKYDSLSISPYKTCGCRYGNVFLNLTSNRRRSTSLYTTDGIAAQILCECRQVTRYTWVWNKGMFWYGLSTKNMGVSPLILAAPCWYGCETTHSLQLWIGLDRLGRRVAFVL